MMDLVCLFKLLVFIYVSKTVDGLQPHRELHLVKRSLELNGLFIYPGTKWCGTGNIAENENDLGKEIETDKCCRKHDFCPDIINGFETKYNITNPVFFTRLSCTCDTEFYECLKSVQTQTAKEVGYLYFSLIGTECYQEEYPITECAKYTNFPRRKCTEYVFDTNGEKIYQWFDVPNF